MKHLNSLYAKVLAGTIGTIVVMGAALAAIIMTSVHSRLEDALKKRGEFMAQHIAGQSATPILTERFFELDMLFRDLTASEKDIEYCFVVNSRGHVVAHTFGTEFPTDLKAPGPALNVQVSRTELLATEKGAILDFAAPILQGRIGTVHLGMSERPIEQALSAMIRQLMLIIMIVLVLGSAAAIILARAITRPVQELVRATREVAGGNLAVAIDIRGTDEIGVLAGSFRDMLSKRQEVLAALKASEKKLADIAASLGEGVLVIDGDGRLTFMNPEAERLLGWTSEELLGEVLHALIHHQRPDGTPYPIGECPSHEVLRNGVRQVVERDMYLCRDGAFLPVSYIAAPIRNGATVVAAVIAFQDITMRQMIEEERERLIGELKEALENVKKLEGMLPICSSCKRIRDDKGGWNQLEVYIHEHSNAEFSHGICPDCAVKLYPDYFKKDRA
ncbi:MAG: PAS domain S-box protein [Nitrospirota bacterium]